MKRFRSTYVATGILIVLAAFVWWTTSQPEPEDPEVAARQVLALPADSIESVLWERPDTPDLRLARDGEVWTVREPLEWRADTAQVQALLDTVSDLTAESRYTDVDDPSVYGLDEPVLTIRFDTGDETRTLHLGNGTPVGSGRYASLEGDPAVYVLTGESVAVIDKLLIDLRDKRVVPVEFSDVTQIVLEGGEASWTLAREGTEWTLQAPFEDAADYWTAQGILSQILGLRAQEFVDDPGPAEEYGLDDPAFSVVVTAGNPPEQEVYRLQFGHAEASNTYYVRRDDIGDTLFAVPDAGVTFAEQAAGDLVDKEVFVDAWEDQVQSVTLEAPAGTYGLVKSEDEWSVEGPEAASQDVATESVFSLMRAVRDVVITGVAAVGEPELPDADWRISVALANGETVSLQARQQESADSWPAVVEGRPHRYQVEGESLESLEASFVELTGAGDASAEEGTAADEENGGGGT